MFGQMDEDSEGTTPYEVQALREYLEGHTISTTAAQRLMTLGEDQVPADGEWDKVTRISWFIWAACMHFPEKGVALLELVETIQAMPELEMTEEQKLRFAEEWKEWKYLTVFDNCLTETYERLWEQRYPGDWEGGPGSPDWVSASSLLANYCIRNSQCFRQLHHCGFKIILTTLEQDPWNHAPPDWQGKNLKSKSPRSLRVQEYRITMLNTNILGLAPWITIAGRLIYNHVDDEPKSILSDNKRRALLKYSDSNLWHGEPRYSKERWAFWKIRLEWISQQEALLETTRCTAKMLVDCMDDIEKDPQPDVWAGRVDRDPMG